MKTSRLILTCILVTFVAALPAIAGPRIFVSGLGNDANPGTREQPKRTFASALTVTDPGGEVVVLDPAGFASSTLLIDKSVSIIVPAGIFGGIRVTSGNAITVAAGPEDTVVLRGLTLNNGGGTNGIEFQSGAALHVENCIISEFTRGIDFSPAADGDLLVKDSIVRGNNRGIHIDSSSGKAIASIDRCRMQGNIDGIFAGNNSRVTVRDSVATHNGSQGFHAVGTNVEMGITHCVSAHNSDGARASSGSSPRAVIRLAYSTITDNARGLETFETGIIYSLGNNLVHGNGVDISGTGSFVAIPGR